MQNLLISINPRHVSNILAGRKTVELRRKPIRCSGEARLWIYATLPVGEVVAVATLSELIEGTPNEIWKIVGAKSCISRNEFDDYFMNANKGYALFLTSVKKLNRPKSLAALREIIKDFHPPQFAKSLDSEKRLLKSLSSGLAAS